MAQTNCKNRCLYARESIFIALMINLALGACTIAQPSNQCRGRDRERCLWLLATEQSSNPIVDSAQLGHSNHPDQSKQAGHSGESRQTGKAKTPWTLISDLLENVSEVMIDGMDHDVIDSRARTWCRADPSTRETKQGVDWTCVLRDPPALFDREFVLEFGDGGVISLTAFDLSSDQSNSLVSQAKKRWHNWCVAGEFTALEGTTYDELHRCAIPGGPYLVLGRFNRDVEADLWQVSIAILATN